MHVIIVGAGIAGLSAAWALTRRGVQVILLEQGTIPNPLSASGDQHRIIRRAYGGQGGYQRRIGAAFEAWDVMWDDLGTKHLVDTGFLLVSQTPDDEATDYRDGLIAGGYPLEEYGPREAADRYPFLDPQHVRFAASSPEGGVLLCQRIGKDLVAWLRRAGCDVRENTRVSRVDAAAGTVVLADGEELVGDHVVVTAGAWVLDLFPGLSTHLTGYRTAVAYLAPPEDLAAVWEAAPAILDVGGTVDGYVLPPVAGMGLKVGAGVHKVKCHADERRAAEPGEGEVLRNLFSPPFARIDEYRVTDVVTCAYTFTSDEHFFVAAEDQATIVSACSGHGYKFGAVVGEQIAEGIISGDRDTMRAWLEARD